MTATSSDTPGAPDTDAQSDGPPVWSLIVHDIRPRYVSGLIRDAIKAAAGVNRI